MKKREFGSVYGTYEERTSERGGMRVYCFRVLNMLKRSLSAYAEIIWGEKGEAEGRHKMINSLMS